MQDLTIIATFKLHHNDFLI